MYSTLRKQIVLENGTLSELHHHVWPNCVHGKSCSTRLPLVLHIHQQTIGSTFSPPPNPVTSHHPTANTLVQVTITLDRITQQAPTLDAVVRPDVPSRTKAAGVLSAESLPSMSSSKDDLPHSGEDHAPGAAPSNGWPCGPHGLTPCITPEASERPACRVPARVAFRQALPPCSPTGVAPERIPNKHPENKFPSRVRFPENLTQDIFSLLPTRWPVCSQAYPLPNISARGPLTQS